MQTASSGPSYQDAPNAEGPSTERRVDLGSHLRTWAGFKHLAVWFTVHVFVDLIGIYFFLMDDPVAGFIFVVIGTSILFYGIATIDKARREEMKHPPI